MKRKFQITAAILSIVAGSLLSGSAIILLATLAQFTEIFGFLFIGFQIIAIILILASVAVIVIGGFLCRNKKSHGLSITIIILLSAIAILEILGGLPSVIFYILLCLVAVGFNITYLCLKEKVPKLDESDLTEKPKKENIGTKTATKNKGGSDKIKLLRELRDLGEISESEYKKLLLAELDDKEKLKD